MAVFELDSTPALVWWRADAADDLVPPEHLCGGLARNEQGGWVTDTAEVVVLLQAATIVN